MTVSPLEAPTEPPSPLGLFFFAENQSQAEHALASGIETLVVDWEWRGKKERQQEADTEINAGTAEELRLFASLNPQRLVCRINPYGPWTAREIDTALDAGASDLLLPMVTDPTQVEAFLSHIAGRSRAGILIETPAACRDAHLLAQLDLDLIYVGLNDLSLGRHGRPLFEPILDGTVEHLRETFRDCPFGFGGLTVLDGGSPTPCSLLITEMARLGCSFSFLRRSWRREAVGRDWSYEVAHLQHHWRSLSKRNQPAIQNDSQALRRHLEELYGWVGD